MAIAIKLGQNIQWGTSGAGTVTQGKILSCDSSSQAKMFEQEDENGETYSVVFYDETAEVTLEILAAPAATIPAVGSELTAVGGVATGLLVTKASTAWKTNTTVKFSVTAKKWVAAGAEEAPPEGP